ncbi:hypothetical protein V1525DRAFT_397926 [Lipomyces kononenkoae]|uniref:Uncharacterized protein n=1 Tax=Lipomyces kononenkoae TaxID=34357 RepID=A0ACC3T6R9_LIPKO
MPPEAPDDTDRDQHLQLPEPQLQQPQQQHQQRPRTSRSPESQFASASPQQLQQQQQQPPASTTPTPTDADHRPRMSTASPFTVGPTLPPVQFDPSSTARRTTPSTPQPQHAAPVEQQQPQPASGPPQSQSLPSVQQLGQRSLTAAQESTPVRAEDAVARVVKKAAAAAASTVSFSGEPSIADSASGGSTNSSVIGSPTLDGEKPRKRRRHQRNHSNLAESGLSELKRNSSSPPPASVYDSMPTRYQLRVDSTDVLKAANVFPSYNLGSLVYTPTPDSHQPIIPRLEDRVNSIIQIRIARRFLSNRTNPHVARREIWGTDVYTDDSDVVAAIYHSGYLAPSSSDGLKGEKGDCVATLRILPLLQKYQGTFRHGINSRTWLTRHDGMSYRIEKVEFVGPGKAEDRGWKMKKRRLEEWRLSKDWREERYGGENLKDDEIMDTGNM